MIQIQTSPTCQAAPLQIEVQVLGQQIASMVTKTSDCAAAVSTLVAALSVAETRALTDEKSIVDQAERNGKLLDSIQNAKTELDTLMASFNEAMAQRNSLMKTASVNKQKADALDAKMAADTQTKKGVQTELENTSKSILGDQNREHVARDQFKVERDAAQILVDQFAEIADIDAVVLGNSAAQNMDECQLICDVALTAMRAHLTAFQSAVIENEGKASKLQLTIKGSSDHCSKRGDEIRSLDQQIRGESEKFQEWTVLLNNARLEAQNMDREVEASSARKSERTRQLDEQTLRLQGLENETTRLNESIAALTTKRTSLVEACTHMKEKFAADGANAAKAHERLNSLRARLAELKQLALKGLTSQAKTNALFAAQVGKEIDKISSAEKAIHSIMTQQIKVDEQLEEARATATIFADECHALDAKKQALAVEVAERRASVAVSDETKSKLTADLRSTQARIAALEQSREARTAAQRDRDALDAYGRDLATRRNQHAIALQSLQAREESQRKRALGEQMKEWEAKFTSMRLENEAKIAELDRAILQQDAPPL